MPTEFLLPLFALTLLANAVLVAVAIRGLRRGHPDLDRPATSLRPSGDDSAPPRDVNPPLTDELKQAIALRRNVVDAATISPAPSEPAPLPPAAPEPEGPPGRGPAGKPSAPREPAGAEVTPPSATAPSATPASATPPPATVPSATPPPATKRRRTTKSDASAKTREPRPAEPPRRGRRRFSLPPDEDHEKLNRSIESFLSGVDGSGSDAAAGAADTSSGGPTTVALVTVDGVADPGPVDPPPARSSTAHDGGAATSDAVAMVERTLRGAARGSDAVSVDGEGRFRVILAGTGELAARAYLRRIRAAVDPTLEASDRPLRLVVATATVLDEPIEGAVRQAERRLASMLAAARGAGNATRADGGRGVDPRAAGD